MASEDQLHSQPADESHDAVATPAGSAPSAADGFTMVDGEQVVDRLNSGGSDRFVLTDRRVIYVGGEEDQRNWSFALISEVSSAEVARARKERATLAWGVLGLIAAIGIWQVATNDTVGIVGGVVMAALGLLLLWDYYLRTPPSRLVFRAGDKDIGGTLSRDAEDGARAFANRLFELRTAGLTERAADPERPAGVTRRYRYPNTWNPPSR